MSIEPHACMVPKTASLPQSIVPNPDPAPETAIFPQFNQLSPLSKLNKWVRLVKNRCAPSRTSLLTLVGRG